MKLEIVELSGRTHEVDSLKLTDTVKDLFNQMDLRMPPGSGKFGLVMEDRVLTCTDNFKLLQDIGIKDGMVIPLVRTSQSEVFEFSGDIGDEERNGAATRENLVRLAFTGESTCLLIRQTHTRIDTGAFTWDICRGTYVLEGPTASCTWDLCFRRRRGGVERAGFFRIDDSGWMKRTTVPASFRHITLNSEAWKKKETVFQERDAILGIRLSGRENCAEALTLMAL